MADTEHERWKGEIAEDMGAQGWPLDKARLVVDLADHACNQAFDAVARVMHTAPDAISTAQAQLLALQMIESRARGAVASTCVLGEALGATASKFKVGQ